MCYLHLVEWYMNKLLFKSVLSRSMTILGSFNLVKDGNISIGMVIINAFSPLYLCVCICLFWWLFMYVFVSLSLSYLFPLFTHLPSSFSSFFLHPHLLYKLKQPVKLLIYLLLITAQSVYKSLSKKNVTPLTLTGTKGFHFMCLTEKFAFLVFFPRIPSSLWTF